MMTAEGIKQKSVERPAKDPMQKLTTAQRRKLENETSLFEIQEIKDIFKPINRTRKIFYP